MKKILWTLPVLGAGYLLALKGRTGHPGLGELRGWNYAHRGLHGAGVPENSLAAFRAAVEHGYGAELDVHLLKDGGLAVIHDSRLERTTGKPGKVEELKRLNILDCMECGSCAFTCPGKLPLVEVFRKGKQMVREANAK